MYFSFLKISCTLTGFPAYWEEKHPLNNDKEIHKYQCYEIAELVAFVGC